MTIEHFCVDYVHKFYKFPPCRHIAEISFVSNVLLDFSNVINIQYNIQHSIISLSSSPLIMRSSTQLFWRRCFFILNSKWSYRNHLKRLKSSEGKLYNNLELLRGFFLSLPLARLHCIVSLFWGLKKCETAVSFCSLRYAWYLICVWSRCAWE